VPTKHTNYTKNSGWKKGDEEEMAAKRRRRRKKQTDGFREPG
jgi:hypothetical protein